jgi:gluconolactonase
MKKILLVLLLPVLFFGCAQKPLNPKLVKTLEPFHTPESILAAPGGVYYVSNIGGFGVNGDGTISKIENDSVTTFASGLNDPKGLAFKNGIIYTADKNQIIEVDAKGNVNIFVDSTAFPSVPKFLNDLAFDNSGNLFVSETGAFDSTDGAVYKIAPDGTVSTFIDFIITPEISSPNGLLFDKNNNLFIIDYNTGKLLKVSANGKELEVIDQSGKHGDGIAFDSRGFLYYSDWDGGRIFRLDMQNKSTVIDSGFTSPADITIDQEKDWLLIPEFNANDVKVVSLY